MKSTIFAVGTLITAVLFSTAHAGTVKWKHLSTTTGDLPVPNDGTQQTSSLVLDIDKNGINDFVITERTKAPSVVWYRRGRALSEKATVGPRASGSAAGKDVEAGVSTEIRRWRRTQPEVEQAARSQVLRFQTQPLTGWTKYVIDDKPLHIEAGGDFLDIDSDGDLDIVFGGDWQRNQVWWWENPHPNHDAKTPWKRRDIKNFGATKHHDQIFGDFDADGRPELVFWNQSGRKLYLAEIPADPHTAESWNCTAIYSYPGDKEPKQRGRYPGFKATNEHEGLAKADIDGDGKLDIVGGGRWFKHTGGTTYTPNIIDETYAFSRSAAGDLIKGGRPEVVLVVGDGWAPLMLYELKDGKWNPKTLIDEIDCGHSLALLDFNGDGSLDIWVAEMRLNGENPDAKNLILLGDGKGNFKTTEVSTGIANHESKIADLDGDGDYDILGKPYGWKTPRLDIWINLTEF